MALSAGEKLGPYQLLSSIGEGGMGEVWKARDTRLDRIVAVKFSKDQFTERFEREARAIAALNHPNVCQLHDVGPNYLVMEYVEGTPLEGPLPVEKAVEYGGQILDALDAAHRKRITHRDLKPANILVTKQGIKLLDFGLAKRAELLDASEATVVAGLSKKGEIVGTLQYMAPEQLQGKEADARSDIFSFGCVLYEMLSGKRAFEGGSAASLIAAILEREPKPVESTPGMQWVIQRCLAKDPDERWRSAADLKAALMWNRRPIAAATSHGLWKARGVWMVAAALLGIALTTIAMRVYVSPPTVEVLRLSVNAPAKAPFSKYKSNTVPVPQSALSHDGGRIAFAAGVNPELWVRSLTDASARALPGTENAQLPFWSPDDRWIGFFADDKLKKTPAAGGAVQVIAESLFDIRGGTWGRDDTILFAPGSQGVWRVASTGGAVSILTTLNASRGDGNHQWPHFLPDGRHFLFLVRARQEHTGIYLGSIDGTPDRLLLRQDSSGIYAQPGYLLYGDGDTLFAQPFDVDRLSLHGPAVAIEQGVGRSSAWQSSVSASNTGRLAYAAVMTQPGRLTWYGRGGTVTGTIGGEEDWTDFRLSPDQQQLAATLVDRKTSIPDLWLSDLGRGSTSRFTFGPAMNASVSWSPDGTRLLFRRNNQGPMELYQQNAASGGASEAVLRAEELRAAGIKSSGYVPTDLSPDAKSGLLIVPAPGTGYDLWSFFLGGDRKLAPFVQASADQLHGNFSPDGQLVAYSSSESGRFEVFVQTFPSPTRKWQVSTQGGSEPRWRHDGREIYYLSLDHKLMAASVGSGPAFGVPAVLFQTQVVDSPTPFRTHYVPSNDGQRFLVNDQSGASSVNAITVVLNWTAGLKK